MSTHVERFMQAVETAGDNGVDTTQLVKVLKGKDMQCVHSAACQSKKKGFCFQNKNGRYIFIGRSKGDLVTTTQKKASSTSELISQLAEKAADLSPNDRTEYLGMIQKQQFYSNAAQALVDANEFKLKVERKIGA